MDKMLIKLTKNIHTTPFMRSGDVKNAYAIKFLPVFILLNSVSDKNTGKGNN